MLLLVEVVVMVAVDTSGGSSSSVGVLFIVGVDSPTLYSCCLLDMRQKVKDNYITCII